MIDIKKSEFDKINEPNEYQFKMEYTVRRADIDVNNHMHNLNYIELANEALSNNNKYVNENWGTKQF